MYVRHTGEDIRSVAFLDSFNLSPFRIPKQILDRYGLISVATQLILFGRGSLFRIFCKKQNTLHAKSTGCSWGRVDRIRRRRTARRWGDVQPQCWTFEVALRALGPCGGCVTDPQFVGLWIYLSTAGNCGTHAGR